MKNFVRIIIVAATVMFSGVLFSTANAGLLPGPGSFSTKDGDSILFSVSNGTPGEIKFCLNTANNITWWKGIKIFGDNTWSAIGLLETTDNDHGPSCKVISVGELRENASRLEFWKAKGAGVHTDIVHYSFSPSQYIGKVLDFFWQKDD